MKANRDIRDERKEKREKKRREQRRAKKREIHTMRLIAHELSGETSEPVIEHAAPDPVPMIPRPFVEPISWVGVDHLALPAPDAELPVAPVVIAIAVGSSEREGRQGNKVQTNTNEYKAAI